VLQSIKLSFTSLRISQLLVHDLIVYLVYSRPIMMFPRNKANLPPKSTGEVAQHANLPFIHDQHTLEQCHLHPRRLVKPSHPRQIISTPSYDDHCPHSKHESVETRIIALAEFLGMPSKDLSKAIAEVARAYVPPASLFSTRVSETGLLVDQFGGQNLRAPFAILYHHYK